MTAIETLKAAVERFRLRIPEDIAPESYRWYQYVYTNLYSSGVDTMTSEDRGALVEISKKLRDEHMICWTRMRMFPVSQMCNRTPGYCNTLLDVINTTTDFNSLKVALCLVRMIRHGDFFVDDYCLKHVPALQAFVYEDA